MSVMNLKRFQMDVRTNRGRPSIILKGDVNAKAAWKLLKQLETFQPSMYPVQLDISDVGTVHWFAARILQSGFEHLVETRGHVVLIHKKNSPSFSLWTNFAAVMSPEAGGTDGA